MIITIDGPAGSGKSTAARRLAQRLGVAYLDTGATYRALTWLAMSRKLDLRDEHALARLAGQMDLQMVPAPQGPRVLVNGQDVSREIRSAAVSDQTQYAARSPVVREVLVALQRRIGRQLGSFVSEGRDQGTVVFPDAQHKFYLDASPEVRARRRCDELLADGENIRYDDILRAIVERDGRDRSRAVAPLVKPPGAVEIDTSDMTIDQVTDLLAAYVEERS